MAVGPLLDAGGWSRVGGRRIDFVTTDEELQGLLAGCLKVSEGPWALIGARSVPDPHRRRRFVHEEFRCNGIDLSSCDPHRKANLWAWSEGFTGPLPPLGADVERLCSWNGFIGVKRLAWAESGGEVGLTLVDRVRHPNDHERTYSEYRRVFERLRRSVRSRLTVPTRRTNIRGEEYVDHLLRWTAAAVEAHSAGTAFPFSPAT